MNSCHGKCQIKIRWLTAVAVLVLFSGCNVGPKYRKPVVTTPDVFRGSPSANASDTESIADLEWFEVFKDEPLQELIRTALAQNYDLRVAIARLDAARANVGMARADKYPTVNAGSTIVSVRPSEGGIVTGAGPLTPTGLTKESTFGSTFLNLLSYEVDLWGRVRRENEAAQAQLLALDWNRKAVTTTLIADVATAYFNLLAFDRELEISKDTLATREESLRLIQRRKTHGASTMLDVRQGEQLVYGATQAIFDAQRKIDETENQISLLLGRNPGPIKRGRLLDQQTPPEVPAGLPSKLLERRPDIRASEQALIAANANIGVAKAAYFPEITLTGLHGHASSDLSNFFNDSQRLYFFAPFLNQSVFTAGRTKSRVRFTEAVQQNALNEYEKAVQTGFREVSDGLVEHQKTREIREQRALLVTALEDRKRLAYMRYRGGIDTMVNALNSDQDLFGAQLSLAQSNRDELLSLVQLYKALGGGWQ
jgi:NodT family efflux transporter outer membrane factor (OMF) lipoprotein